LLAILGGPCICGRVAAQAPAVASGWRTAEPAPAASAAPITPTSSGDEVTHAQVTEGDGTLPRDHGQVWREYDISPYTMRVNSAEEPEQQIVDWILRETGYEAWHATPVGLLSADRRTLRVYHTPQMQTIVADIVDRFVSTRAQNHGFGLRIVTLKNPNWRTRAMALMTAIPVQSPGVQGWIMAKENAALLMSELRRRSDYRETNTPHQMVFNGQRATISTLQPRSYAKGLVATPAAWPGFQIENGQIEEGYVLEFSPLLSTDARTTDAVVKLRLSQIERMIKVPLDTPSPLAQNQRTEIEVPQVTAVQLHERFRWPSDQVLLLSMGVAPAPGPEGASLLGALPLPKTAPRADALLFIESTGTVAQTTATPGAANVATPQTAETQQRTFHGRY
jgi:hypothetical protein